METVTLNLHELTVYLGPLQGPKTPRQAEVDNHVAMLNALGSADAIAEFLHEQHIVGVQGHAGECAIARWLRKVANLTTSVFAGTGAFLTGDEYALPATFSAHVTEFIKRFDSGAYPNITEPVEPCLCGCQTISITAGFSTEALVAV